MKWTQSIGTGGSISVNDSHVQLFNGSTTTYISQPVPSAQSFTVIYKSRYAGFLALANGSFFGGGIRLVSGTLASPSSSIYLQKYYQVSNVFGMQYNTEQALISGAANYATVLNQVVLGGEVAPYWRLQFVYSTRATSVSYSFDGVTWFVLGTYTGAQTGFSTTPPALMAVDAFSNGNGNGFGVVFIDWFKVTTP